MTLKRAGGAALALAMDAAVTATAAQNPAAPAVQNPFEFLEPSIQISADDRAKLDRRDVVLHILPAHGRELAVIAASEIDVGPDSFADTIRNIRTFKRGPLVPQIHRFSREPRLQDVSELTLDPVDIDEIRSCRTDRCGLKLTPDEIERLHQALSNGSGDAREPVTNVFRQIMVERATAYLRRGDRTTERQFSTLLEHWGFIHARAPELATYLLRYPAAPLSAAESFLYWSKETYAWKPMITITHLTMLRHDGTRPGWPEVLVVSRDVFATRYTSGSLILTMLFRDSESSSRRYLVYLNRTWVDGIRALWRPFVEHRIKTQARRVFAGARERIEGNARRRTSESSTPRKQ